MKYEIKNIVMLKKILWIDFIFGFIAGIVGLVFYDFFIDVLNLPGHHILIISSVTILYSICAFYLAQQKKTSILLLRFQINANWFWTIVSLGLLIFYFNNATKLGVVYLFLQIGIVGGLAFLEGNQLKKTN